MSDCCGQGEDTGATSCCGGPGGSSYDYGVQPFEDGTVGTFAGPVPRLSTSWTPRDRRGAWRVRLGIRRDSYRVRPGLYAVGEPDDTSHVLVTANYKLTVDLVRTALADRSAWLLVLDTRGVNVWCAAGKGTFSTEAVVRAVRDSLLEQVVSHRRLILPQLGATGVAAHEVRRLSGRTVTWGPVRIEDLPAFLDAGLQATPEMRRVRFALEDRARLVGVELSVLWRPRSLVVAAVLLAALLLAWYVVPAVAGSALMVAGFLFAGLIAGSVVVPLLLPWIPGRAFALKGGLVGVAVAALSGYLLWASASPAHILGAALLSVALASYSAMNFTGATTFTSPSGVEWEMRRAIPLQLIFAVTGTALILVALIGGRV